MYLQDLLVGWGILITQQGCLGPSKLRQQLKAFNCFELRLSSVAKDLVQG